MAHRFSTFALVALVALLVVAGLAGCSAPATPQQPSNSPTPTGTPAIVTARDASSTVLGVVGETLIVQLPANPSTGYTWKASTVPTFMAQVGEPVFGSSTATATAGAPGTQSFTFAVKATGNAPLTLVYARPFDKGVPPAKTFTVTVNTY